MILSALNDYYHRLVERQEDGVSAYGYSLEKISYAIVLSPEGNIVDVNDIRDQSGKKPSPKLLPVPASFKRPGTTPRPFFLWDKSSFVLGVERKGTDTVTINKKPHEAFKIFHTRVLVSCPRNQ